MVNSMTGFAAGTGAAEGFDWSWDLRSVNARGLDLRLRVPDWISGLEPELRKALSAALGRGSVALSLRLTRAAGAAGLQIDPGGLAQALDGIARVQAAAADAGIALAETRAADILAMRGVSEAPQTDTGEAARLKTALVADFGGLLDQLLAMRRDEGAALKAVIATQLDEIAALTVAAQEAAGARQPRMRETLKAALEEIMATAEGLDEARVLQELAVLALKSDVTEELDRLSAHVDAARELLDAGQPVGRRLDFLCQEFNREANTLCAKSGAVALTRIGLDLKAAIDQMREQIQNVE